MTPVEARIASTILGLLDARAPGSTICPSEAARALSDDEATWRALMPEVRRVAAALAAEDRLRVTARGKDVDALTAPGPIRLGRPLNPG